MDKTSHYLRDLENKWALVTGAASGIGDAIAGAFMTAGIGTIVADINDEALRAVSWRDYHAIYKVDVCNPPTLYAPFHFLDKTGHAYDIVVHCAGVAGGHPFESMPDSEWERVVDTNLKGTFNVAREAIGHFIKHKKKGSLILIGSISGIVSNGVEFNNVHYCASKAGVHGLARSLAVEVAKYGIRVNVLAPGLVRTPMSVPALEHERGKAFEARHPLGKAYPSEIVGPALFLASNMSNAVTGHILVCDKGYTAC